MARFEVYIADLSQKGNHTTLISCFPLPPLTCRSPFPVIVPVGVPFVPIYACTFTLSESPLLKLAAAAGQALLLIGLFMHTLIDAQHRLCFFRGGNTSCCGLGFSLRHKEECDSLKNEDSQSHICTETAPCRLCSV